MGTKIIIEICQNHQGDRGILRDMIKAAAEAGADYVKMQSLFSDDLTNRPRFEEGKVDETGVMMTMKRPYAPERERLSKLDLSLDDHCFFIEECLRHKVIPMTTIFARHRVPEIGNLPWPVKVVKVASYDCGSHPMIRDLMKYFDHLIISTGASHDHEIEKTARLVREHGTKLTFLHCVTSYPNTLDMANLKRMEWLRTLSGETGWSDHTLVERDRLIAVKVAIYHGADYVERHFTILPKDKSKDGPVSITPELLRELSEFRKKSKQEQLAEIEHECSEWGVLFGEARRKLTPTELLNRDYYRGRFAECIGNNEWKYNWE